LKGSEVQGSAQQLAAEAAILIEKETPGCGVSHERRLWPRASSLIKKETF
jgi:hypothetical protein